MLAIHVFVRYSILRCVSGKCKVVPKARFSGRSRIYHYAKDENMVKEVNPMIHVNERDYPVNGHHCDDPEKAKLVKKLALLITCANAAVCPFKHQLS